jgi:hypothetical protein
MLPPMLKWIPGRSTGYSSSYMFERALIYVSVVSISCTNLSTLGNEGLFDPPRADSESQPDATDSDSWAIDDHSTLVSPLSTKLFQ